MIIGRERIWLPDRLLRRKLGAATTDKAIPFITRRVRWFERFARPRLARLLELRPATIVLGFVTLVFIVAAFVAPPFTGLDTVPAMGVVAIALSLVLEDIFVTAIGIALGSAGVVLEIALGSAAFRIL